MHPGKILLALTFAALHCLLLHLAASAQPIPLRYAQAPSAMRSIFSLPVAVAERQEFFRREGLDFKIVVPIPGGSDRMIDALHDDTADLTHVATAFLIRAALTKSDAAAIIAEFNNPIYSLIAKPEIKSFAALKGKLLGLADEAGSITLSMRKLLALNGLQPGDFRVKTIEGTATRFNCLKRGECDAVPLGQPQDLIAVKDGYRLLGLSTDAVPDFIYTVTAARRSWAEKNKEPVLRYVRGLAAAFKFIREPANRAAVVKTIVDWSESSANIAEQTLNLYFAPERNVLPMRGEINVKGMAQVIAFMGERGTLKTPLPPPERFVDLQYLRAAGIQ